MGTCQGKENIPRAKYVDNLQLGDQAFGIGRVYPLSNVILTPLNLAPCVYFELSVYNSANTVIFKGCQKSSFYLSGNNKTFLVPAEYLDIAVSFTTVPSRTKRVEMYANEVNNEILINFFRSYSRMDLYGVPGLRYRQFAIPVDSTFAVLGKVVGNGVENQLVPCDYTQYKSFRFVKNAIIATDEEGFLGGLKLNVTFQPQINHNNSQPSPNRNSASNQQDISIDSSRHALDNRRNQPAINYEMPPTSPNQNQIGPPSYNQQHQQNISQPPANYQEIELSMDQSRHSFNPASMSSNNPATQLFDNYRTAPPLYENIEYYPYLPDAPTSTDISLPSSSNYYNMPEAPPATQAINSDYVLNAVPVSWNDVNGNHVMVEAVVLSKRSL